MARSNKYTSINFNDIFEKKSNNRPSSSTSTSTPSSSSLHGTSRNHGGMLVLTRPSPKPLPQLVQPQTPKPLLQSPKSSSSSDPDHRSESEPISLRPLGRTGSSSLTLSSPSLPTPQDNRDKETPISLKPEPFVPPHLRPGFAGREERFGQNGQRNQGVRSRETGPGQVQYGSSNGCDENGRPKSGGGYERTPRGSESDQADVNRPSSSGSRPGSGGSRPSSSGNRQSSGGWYGSSYRSPTQS